MIFSTKGFAEAADTQRSALEASLVKASQGGRIPIVVDTSPCLAQLKAGLTDSQLRCAAHKPLLALHPSNTRHDAGLKAIFKGSPCIAWLPDTAQLTSATQCQWMRPARASGRRAVPAERACAVLHP